ncbi:MAG: hypothetical protein BJ554DRAFT_5083, partial [Olpidium bornovanus]
GLRGLRGGAKKERQEQEEEEGEKNEEDGSGNEGAGKGASPGEHTPAEGASCWLFALGLVFNTAYTRREELWVFVKDVVHIILVPEIDGRADRHYLADEYERVKRERPELFGDDLGRFKEEFQKETRPGDIGPFGIYVARKTYVNWVIRNGEEVIIKKRMKGADLERDKVITGRVYKGDGNGAAGGKEVQETHERGAGGPALGACGQVLLERDRALKRGPGTPGSGRPARGRPRRRDRAQTASHGALEKHNTARLC